MAVKLVIRWLTRDRDAIEAIRRRFAMPHFTTLNGMAPAEIEPADRELFDECARRGFFCIIDKTWRQKGGQIIFISRQ